MDKKLRKLPGFISEDDDNIEEEEDLEDVDVSDINEELPMSEKFNTLLIRNFAKKDFYEIFQILTNEFSTTYFKDDRYPRDFAQKMKNYFIIYFQVKEAFGDEHAKAILSPLIAQDITYAFTMKSYQGFIPRLIRGGLLPSKIEENRIARNWGWFKRKEE